MPKIDRKLISKKKDIIVDLKKIIKAENVLDHEDETRPFETDALSAYKQKPMVVIFPENTEEVSKILAYCNQQRIKVVPRGAGTGLSGGALPLADSILLCLGKFNKIIDIDYKNRCVVAQPGVTNLSITQAVQDKGFYYAPDPSSQIACSIGGNVAENSGGVHSLKYGTTTNNLFGVEIVLMDGTISRLGGKTFDSEGYDLLGLVTGSEGLLCVITEVTVKILKKPQTIKAALIGFSSIEDGGRCVSDIIASGIIPSGMEMMDKALIHATDNFVKAGYPRDAESMLIVELDGTKKEVEELIERVNNIAKKNKSSSIKISKNERQRLKFWAGRKAAFPACGDMAPDYYCMDGTIPRRIERTEKFGADILKYCVKVGGVLTGEHGVGVEKRELMCEMFNNNDIQQQIKIKKALDSSSLLNPGKVYPILRKCAEEGRVHVHRGKTKFANIPRF